ncbi:MAG: histidine kinase [Verrucomicrobiota bacterium]
MQKRARNLVCVTVLATLLASSQATTTPPADSSLEHLSTTQLNTRLNDLKQELATLPRKPLGPKGGTFGYASSTRSPLLPDPSKWVTIDLGEIVDLEEVFLIPAVLVRADRTEISYGFPRRFKVEIATDSEFSDSMTILDASQEAFPLTDGYPIRIPVDDIGTRFIKITAIELVPQAQSQAKDRGFFGLAEVLAFAGPRNVALGKTVSALDQIDSPPYWHPNYLVDGFSSLGQPLAPSESRSGDFRSKSQKSEAADFTVTVDLGNFYVIDEIRLFPAHARMNFASFLDYGYGFPLRFKVELSHQPDFASADVVFSELDTDILSPGDSVFSIPIPARSGRFVRLTVTKLPQIPETGEYRFALSELQVIANGRNVARGKEVSLSNSLPNSNTSPNPLVDDMVRDGNIIPVREWLQGLARYPEVSREINALEKLIEQRRISHSQILRTTLVLALLAVLALAFLLFMNRRARRRHIAGIREQIASDLHDEIGSNLGSIALTSENLAQTGSIPEADRGRLSDIAGTARESSQTIRDIVWLLNTKVDEGDLILRLRQTAARMLGHMNYSFDVPTEEPAHRIPLEMRRHLLLFFKEALHNLVRHAQADEANILVSGQNGALSLTIQDDGVGITNPDSPHQLQQLKSRAKQIPGRLTVNSAPHQGTTLNLFVSLPGS